MNLHTGGIASWSKTRWFLFWFAVLLGAGIVRIFGDQFLRPLPIWVQLLIVVVGVCVIAAIAIYGRRRARRSSLPR